MANTHANLCAGAGTSGLTARIEKSFQNGHIIPSALRPTIELHQPRAACMHDPPLYESQIFGSGLLQSPWITKLNAGLFDTLSDGDVRRQARPVQPASTEVFLVPEPAPCAQATSQQKLRTYPKTIHDS